MKLRTKQFRGKSQDSQNELDEIDEDSGTESRL